ncbi:hypothetical protein EDD18DRAFT_1156276 [Armillaria luteobubalina]|uniref:Uncharacterized protein n=1 Tax=Armillaria luteobubalina TaxID=153913 RepID=A0AA39Q8A0_9AGAR|nr:hypothetical protein EDD18DRAFT_1156276 [Armillaria luteobubalina]
MDVQALIWLINMSSNLNVENIVIESTSALPLKSVDSFERGVHHTNVGRACTQSLRPLFLEPDVSAHESKMDRLIQARLRFTYSLYNPNIPDMPTPAKDRLSSTLYADLLCIHPGCDEEIRELLLSNLMTSDDNRTALHLQPIIWARLLARVSMSDSSPDALAVMQMLFTEIPSSYWKADYVPITYALDTLQMKLPSGSNDGDVTLRVAIKKSLYIFVAEDILSWHMRFEPPIICRNYKNDLFENFYPYSRLRLLLSMASSRSMRSMADSHMQSIPDSYFKQSMTGKHLGRNIPSSPFAHNRSLFITIIESIGELVDIEAPHEDNDNRRTVLEFLHALITSVEFDDSLTLREQRSALMMFFRVLNSTSCRPPFLEKDWCTPRLATKSVQIALRDFDSPTHELGTYFFQHTSFTNETLVSFVSALFEESSPQINVRSEYLVHVSLQSLEYLHEPDSLFISCTTLIQWNDTRTLRRLTLLHPKHDSWSGCIQRLEDSGMDGAVVAEFKAFIRAGCVGGYGEDDAPPSSSSVSSPEENEKPPQHMWLTMRYRVQQFITGKPRHGGIELSRDDHRAQSM